MNKTYFKTKFLWLFFSTSLFVLSACGQDHQPMALNPVTPIEGVQPSAGENPPGTLLETIVKRGVPEAVASLALSKYDEFYNRVHNKRYMAIVDYSQPSGNLRFYLINVGTGEVNSIPVAHGSGSDPKRTGVPQYFSNRDGSKMSSIGAFLASETYHSSKVGHALRLDGLESTNGRARDRGVVIHAAKYVKFSLTKQGMSWGCPAVPTTWVEKVLTILQGGSFMYAYGSSKFQTNVHDLGVLGGMVNPAQSWFDEGESAPTEGEF